MEAVAPEDESADADEADGVEAGDGTVLLVENLQLFVDGRSSGRRGEIGLRRAEQDPPVSLKRLTGALASERIGCVALGTLIVLFHRPAQRVRGDVAPRRQSV